MRPKLIPSLGGVLLVSVLASVASATAVMAVALSHYDGVYSIEITTTAGACDKNYRGSVTVSNGRIAALSDPGATAEGGVEDNGTVSLLFREGGQIVNVGGKLGPRSGRGPWSSPTAQCGGWWHAERQE
ncbi:MAG TPA: hypothetical protein VKV77_03030 [Methylovirgula sp.]|nr:hypothetical protein [Methylovirgula sp.]